jgi:hypothetical protein
MKILEMINMNWAYEVMKILLKYCVLWSMGFNGDLFCFFVISCFQSF